MPTRLPSWSGRRSFAHGTTFGFSFPISRAFFLAGQGIAGTEPVCSVRCREDHAPCVGRICRSCPGRLRPRSAPNQAGVFRPGCGGLDRPGDCQFNAGGIFDGTWDASGPSRAIAFFVPGAFLSRVISQHWEAEPGGVEIKPQFLIRDRIIDAFASRLAAEAEHASPNGQLYAESACEFLTHHIIHHIRQCRLRRRDAPAGCRDAVSRMSWSLSTST